MSWPNPRFRTLEDAKKYIETADTRLCITVYLAEDTPNGRMVRVNPDYRDAPYEFSVVWHSEHAGVKLLSRL